MARNWAKALIATPNDIGAALAAYESDLFPRSAEVADATAQNLSRFFGDDAPHSVVDLFSQYLKGRQDRAHSRRSLGETRSHLGGGYAAAVL